MDFKELVDLLVMSVVSPLLGIILMAAVVFFLWNIFGVIKNSGKPDELAKFKNKAFWGVIAITVMVSMWGLVNFLKGTLQLEDTTPINLDRFEQTL